MADNTTKPEQAHLHTLKFTDVAKGDENALNTLVDACEKDGFFYLDLRGWESNQMLDSLQTAAGLMKEWFKQPLDKKLATETLSDAHGYAEPSPPDHTKYDTLILLFLAGISPLGCSLGLQRTPVMGSRLCGYVDAAGLPL